MFRKRLIVVISAAVIGILVAGLIVWSKGKGQVPYEMGGEKNGFELFLKAGTLMRSVQAPTSTNEYAGFVATNREALMMVREGLKLRVEAPESAYDVQTVLDKLATFKGLGKAMEIEGKNAEAQGEFGKAANVYLDLVRFGQKVEAGPLIHFLVGLAVQDMGLRGLEALEPKLNEAERARVAAELEALVGSRMRFEEILARERFFMRRNAATPYHYVVGLFLTRAAIKNAQGKYERHGQNLARVAGKYGG